MLILLLVVLIEQFFCSKWELFYLFWESQGECYSHLESKICYIGMLSGMFCGILHKMSRTMAQKFLGEMSPVSKNALGNVLRNASG